MLLHRRHGLPAAGAVDGVAAYRKVLLDAGLIERHAKGTRNCYSLRGERLAALERAFGGLFAGLAGSGQDETSAKVAELA